MVFNDFSPEHEKCDLPFNIDCSKRPERRECGILNLELVCPQSALAALGPG